MTMASNVDLASQIIGILSFLATLVMIFRYLNPKPGYMVFMNRVGQLRKSWHGCDREELLPSGDWSALFVNRLEHLESEVRDLIFVTEKNAGCLINSWINSFRIKKLSREARLLLNILPHLVQLTREINDAKSSSNLIVVETKFELRNKFIQLMGGPELCLPPVQWSPSRDDIAQVPPNTPDRCPSRHGSQDSWDGTMIGHYPEPCIGIATFKSDVAVSTKENLCTIFAPRNFLPKRWRKKGNPELPY